MWSTGRSYGCSNIGACRALIIIHSIASIKRNFHRKFQLCEPTPKVPVKGSAATHIMNSISLYVINLLTTSELLAANIFPTKLVLFSLGTIFYGFRKIHVFITSQNDFFLYSLSWRQKSIQSEIQANIERVFNQSEARGQFKCIRLLHLISKNIGRCHMVWRGIVWLMLRRLFWAYIFWNIILPDVNISWFHCFAVIGQLLYCTKVKRAMIKQKLIDEFSDHFSSDYKP